MGDRAGHAASLCWSCRKAAAPRDKKCSWARSFEPVKGWEARATVLMNNPSVQSFQVTKCPEFEPDRGCWECLKRGECPDRGKVDAHYCTKWRKER